MTLTDTQATLQVNCNKEGVNAESTVNPRLRRELVTLVITKIIDGLADDDKHNLFTDLHTEADLAGCGPVGR